MPPRTKPAIPARIVRARSILEEPDLWVCAKFTVQEAIRTMRKWLDDPDVADELRDGDMYLLARGEEHIASRPPNRITL